MTRIPGSGIVLLLVWSWSGLLSAQTPLRPALHWSRAGTASSCIDPQALALRVTALTGAVLVEPTSADLSIEGHIEKTAAGAYEVHISATRKDGLPRGARELRQQGGDCRKLDAAIAFIIAVLIDPDLALEQLPPELVALGVEGAAPEQALLTELERVPPKPVVLPAAVPPPAARPPPPSAPVVARPRPTLGLTALLSALELPHLALGALVGGSYPLAAWLTLEAQLRAAAMSSPLTLDEVRSVAASQVGGTLLACARTRERWQLFLDGCLGPDVGATFAKGRGFASNHADSLSSYGAQLVLGSGLRVSARVLLQLRGFVRINVNTPRFVYERSDGTHEAFQLGRAALGATSGASYLF